MKLTPRTIKAGQEHKLRRDNVTTRKSWILLDTGEIVIANQQSGEEATGKVRLTRREFNIMVDWYNGQPRR